MKLITFIVYFVHALLLPSELGLQNTNFKYYTFIVADYKYFSRNVVIMRGYDKRKHTIPETSIAIAYDLTSNKAILIDNLRNTKVIDLINATTIVPDKCTNECKRDILARAAIYIDHVSGPYRYRSDDEVEIVKSDTSLFSEMHMLKKFNICQCRHFAQYRSDSHHDRCKSILKQFKEAFEKHVYSNYVVLKAHHREMKKTYNKLNKGNTRNMLL